MFRVATVFFDMGGTLLKPNREYIMRTILRNKGIEVPITSIHRAFVEADKLWEESYDGKGLMGIEAEYSYQQKNRMVLHSLGLINHELLQAVNSSLQKSWIQEKLYRDAEPCLRLVKEKGIDVGIISNASPEMNNVIKRLGIDKYARTVVISELVGKAKPDPAIFEHALKMSGRKAHESLYIGDYYKIDVLGARRAGMQAVLIDRDDRYSGIDCAKVRNLGEFCAMVEPL
ncbi:MAG: HAD family hydrolase [Conexivisphaerales archaeon]